MDNYEQAKKLFAHLWRAGAWAMFWVNPGKVSHWFATDAIPHRIKADFSRNLYFGVNPCAAIPTTNAKGEQAQPETVRAQLTAIAALNCLFAEFDAHDADKLDVLTKIRLLTPAPSVIIDSGGGYHCYWLLDAPLVLTDDETREYARNLQRRWVAYVGGDTGAADLARVLRVPGSRNWKPDYAPHFPEVAFVRWLNIEYSLHQLTGILPAPQTPRREYEKQGATNVDRAVRVAVGMIERAYDGEKHHTLLRAARLLGGYVAGGGLSRSDALDVLRQAIEGKAGVRSLAGALKTIEDGLDYGELAPIEVGE